jgi:hypothetical protein
VPVLNPERRVVVRPSPTCAGHGGGDRPLTGSWNLSPGAQCDGGIHSVDRVRQRNHQTLSWNDSGPHPPDRPGGSAEPPDDWIDVTPRRDLAIGAWDDAAARSDEANPASEEAPSPGDEASPR